MSARCSSDVHQFCTPTRTSVQSGRLPVHVSTGLGSPCGDSTGISQNMTGFAERLQEAGYTTAFAGKWDAGMVRERQLLANICLPPALLDCWISSDSCGPFHGRSASHCRRFSQRRPLRCCGHERNTQQRPGEGFLSRVSLQRRRRPNRKQQYRLDLCHSQHNQITF